MEIKEYEDGIAFLKNNIEIAFYSNITERLTFNFDGMKAYSDYDCLASLSYPIKDIMFVFIELDEYLVKQKIKKEYRNINRFDF